MRVNQKKIGPIYVFILIAALVAIGKIIYIQVTYDPEKSIVVRNTTRDDVIECTRGSILADDGRYLAFSIPEYRLAIDPCQAKDTTMSNGIDGLAKELSKFYKDKKASEYKKMILDARKAGKRYLYINRKLITYQEMQQVRTFPILREGKLSGGVMFEKVDHRTYPYNRLAYRTLGYIKNQEDTPVIGIEGSCDSILRGTQGSQPMRLSEHNTWIADYERERIEPVDGTDVQLTINVDFQQLAHNALMKKLSETDQLSAGTVILMEVATGEIKAMVNLEKKGNKFDETYNYAIGRVGEPGSVFKAASLTILLEDGKVKLDQEIPAVVNWSFKGKSLPADHYLDGYSTISVKHGFEISSNNVFRMLVGDNYGSNPQEYIDKLKKLKIAENFDFDIKGFGKAHIKNPEDKGWSPIDLPQIGMGYTVEVTPLHTLNYYNAIANDGVMVKPHLIRNYQKDGMIIREFKPETMTTVASKNTVKEVKRAMRGVVENGTGKTIFSNCPIEVAGKTGTARIVIPSIGRYEDASGNKMHQATFVGFFPYEQPKYSMIVVVYSSLTKQNFYGATWAGPVFEEIAENIYATAVDWNEPLPATGSRPVPEEYRYLDTDKNTAVVPNVIGMGLKDALYLLEKRGFTVKISGEGHVCEQVPHADSSAYNRIVSLTLKQLTDE